jgi:hypothetical protein
MSFEFTLGPKGPFGIAVPPSVVESFGAGKRVPVIVTVGTHSYRSTVAPYAGHPYMVPLSYENAAAAGVGPGDTLVVTLEHDTAPRLVEVPADLAAALDAAGAQGAWAALSYSNQNAHVLAVTGAKTDETRARRVTSVVEKLRAG